MRWYVDISPLGARKSEGGSKSAGDRHCVEAAQWQEALKVVRERRGDQSSLGDFAIELLDEGCRAIDPATRTRYVVHRAPADAPESRGEPLPSAEEPSSAGPSSAAPSAKPSSRGRARPSSRGGRAAEARTKSKGRVSIPDDPVPRGPTLEAAPGTHSPTLPSQPESDRRPAARRSSVPPAPVPAPMQAETAFERMAGGIAVALPSEVNISHDAPTEVLPPFKVVFRRSEEPTPAAPITYRELAYAVAEGTSVRDAESVARAQLEVIQNAISGAPKGKFIQLAVFDHEFKGRPSRPPLVTLAFKDWRGSEPTIDYPADRTTTSAVAKAPGAGEVRAPESLRAPQPTLGGDAGAPPAKALEVTIVEPAPGLAEQARRLSASAERGAEARSDATTSAERTSREPDDTKAEAVQADVEAEPGTRDEAAPVTEPSAIAMAPVMSVGDGPAVVATPEARHASTAPPARTSTPPPAVEVARVVPMPTPSELRREAHEMAGDDEATVVQEPSARASAPPPAPAPTASAPPPAPAPTASAPPPAPAPTASAPPPAPAPTASAPPPAPAPTASAPPPASVLPSGGPLSKRPPPAPRGALVLAAKGRRKKGDDLLTDLFEACGDLAFLNDVLEAAEFAGRLLVESLPCRLCLVSFYDIDKAELVVVRQIVAESTTGDEPPASLLMQRIADRVGGLGAVLRRGKAVLAGGADFSSDPRLEPLGVPVKSAIRGPVNHGGRYLGLIELFDPLDGKGFTDADTHAVHYVAEQLGDFVDQRGITLDAERVLRPKLAEIARA